MPFIVELIVWSVAILVWTVIVFRVGVKEGLTRAIYICDARANSEEANQQRWQELEPNGKEQQLHAFMKQTCVDNASAMEVERDGQPTNRIWAG
jgi:hypothetical protein